MGNQVRVRREQLGMSQKELAAQVDISRQTLNAIEADRQSPSVVLALKLAGALCTQVEALFASDDAREPSHIDAALAGRLRGQTTRVLACELRGRYVAHPLPARPTREVPASHSAVERVVGQAADGIAVAAHATHVARGRVRVDLAASLDQVRDNFVIAGAAPGLSLLCDHLNRSPGPGRFRCLPHSPRAALTALARSQVHSAAAHVAHARPSEVCRELARYLPSASAHVLALASWEGQWVGLVVPDDIRDPRVVRMRETLLGAALQRDLRALGYDTRLTGQELARITLD